jgi:hypothetical protein
VRESGKEGEKGAGNAPYRNVELLRHLLNGGRRRSGGASGGRGAAAAACAARVVRARASYGIRWP